MASIRREVAGRSIQTLFGLGAVGGLSDSELIVIYLDRRGEASELAFSAIVERHGPMVLGVCRRMLGDRQAAEDAFQATFLILARKAGSVHVDGSIGRWLHGVSRRVAGRTRRVKLRESSGIHRGSEPSTDFDDSVDRDEVRAAVDEEVGRLPRHYRSAVILCHLEGLTHDRAAEALGCPVGTVRSRLSRARDLLRTRLTRRGLAPASIAAMFAIGGAQAGAAVMPIGRGMASVAASAMARDFFRRMMMKQLIQLGVVATLAAGLVGAGGSAMVGGQEPLPVAKAPAPVKPIKQRFDELVEDQYKRRSMWIQANLASKPFEERTEAERKLERPMTPEWARKYLAMVDEEPTGPVAPDALFHAFLSVAYPGYMTGGKPEDYARIREERAMAESIVDRLLPFAADPRMAGYCHAIGEGLGLRAEVLLREVMARSTDRRSRGFACQSLGTLLGYFAQTRLLHDDRKIAEGIRRDFGQRFLDGLKGRDPREMEAEALALHQRVVAEFGDIRLDLDPEETQVLAQESLKWLAKARSKDVGRVAPEIAVDDVQGRQIRWGGYRGKVVVLTFWASWSPLSLHEATAHRILAATFRDRPFALLGVDLDHDAVVARKALAESGIESPTWFDGSSIRSDYTGTISEAYHIVELPTVLVIDAKGVIRAQNLQGQALAAAVEALLKEQEAGGNDGR